MVTVSDGKSKPESVRIHLTMELLILQKYEVCTPTNSVNSNPPSESKVGISYIFYPFMFDICMYSFDTVGDFVTATAMHGRIF